MRQITVNVVAPAATATAMLVGPNRVGTSPKTPPIGRFIAPEATRDMPVPVSTTEIQALER
jgi:NAD(P)-dependent dehydrogenase (short-subunit alcohol dehydrogenase family)